MQLLNNALRNHQVGRWQEAEQPYRQVLAGQPDNADAILLSSGMTVEKVADFTGLSPETLQQLQEIPDNK